MGLLTDSSWKTSYRNEDGDLVKLFFEPALQCAQHYDRMTGYFSANVLSVAARGINALVANGGRMRLVVGCTLQPAEVEAIAKGYDLRAEMARTLAAVDLTPATADVRAHLEMLAWMISQGMLDVKVAVPVDGNGHPVFVEGIYHEKVGIVTDSAGSRLSFSGSINETQAGWVTNRESFHVHCEWEAGRDAGHVADEVEAFLRLWEDRSRTVRVFDFPDAARQKLLEFLPLSDRPVTPPVSPVAVAARHRLTPDEFRRIVWGFAAHAAGLKNGLRVGEMTSAVEPWPHQIRTYTRFLGTWPARVLIADEVGLGKTISAGLILRQARLSGAAARILLMVPASLMIQWQNELYEKFNLRVPRYEGEFLIWPEMAGAEGPRERKVKRGEWLGEPFVICSSHLMRRKDRAAELIGAQAWDLVVLDEAHHARRKAAGSNQEGGPNALLALMRNLRERCASLLLLTATPMQVDPVEVWDLLQLLGLPQPWADDARSMGRYFELTAGNPSEHELEWLVRMFHASEKQFGKLPEVEVERILPAASGLRRRKLLRVLRDLHDPIGRRALSAVERADLLRLLQAASPLHWMMIRNTRKLLREYVRSGRLNVPIAERKVEDRPIELNASERRVYEMVEQYISETYNAASPEKRSAIGFVMTIYRRRLASSFKALRKTLSNRLAKIAPVSEEDVSQDEVRDEQMSLEEANQQASESLGWEERAGIEVLLREISKLNTDTKAKQLKVELEGLFGAGYSSAIVFTQYTDTMEYLGEHLALEMAGRALATYSGKGGTWLDSRGEWHVCSKEDIKRRLRDELVEILICTDAAGEGLNLQTCGALVNYDLPWNPMKVEQRIGRIDRIGQRYPVVRIVNLAYKDTVEADVFFTVGSRINLFEGIVGKLQPILSRLPKRIEQFTLASSDAKELARNRFMAEIEAELDEAGRSAFDIDTAALESLEIPELPFPPVTLQDLDSVMHHAAAVPQGMSWQQKDGRSYGVSIPGMKQEVRVTTSASDFDYSPDNLQLFSPGGAVFEAVEAAGVGTAADADEGVCWIVDGECVIRTDHGFQTMKTMSELLAWAERPGKPGVGPTSSGDGAPKLLA